MTNPQQPMSTRWPLTPSSLMIFLQTGQYWHDGRPAGPGDQSESVDSRDNTKKMQIRVEFIQPIKALAKIILCSYNINYLKTVKLNIALHKN